MLDESTVDPDPFRQLARWYDEAVAAAADEAERMVVATANADGRPSARMVLLRGLDERGLCFFTNLDSAKARDLDENPRAELVLHWPATGRQVRVHGHVERVGDHEAASYFARRPRASQLGAWASPQSRAIGSRAELEARVATVATRFGDEAIPLPPFWGGYRVVPESIELWEHRDDRLHDRVRYRCDDRRWIVERLAP